MRDIGTGQVEFLMPDGSIRQYAGEVEVKGDRVIVTEIVYLNAMPGGAREINLPAQNCIILWKPEVYDHDQFVE